MCLFWGFFVGGSSIGRKKRGSSFIVKVFIYIKVFFKRRKGELDSFGN